MAKSEEYNKAIKLRAQGESIKEIARTLSVSKSTASIWCRNIQLTSRQITRLSERMREGSYRGRLRGAIIQKERKLQRIERCRIEGKKLIGILSKREILVAGVALYWGEGTKGGDRLQLVNSNSAVVRFFISWLKDVFNVPIADLRFSITLNEVHKERKEEIEKYWRNFLNVSQDQFTKTILISTKNKKHYANFKSHYGTLRVTVRRSSKLQRIVNGCIEELSRQ